MPFALALVAAGFYGAADFLGGFATKRAPTITVVILSQIAGIVTVLLVQTLLPLPGSPTPTDLAWGAAAGLAGGSGLALFYKGLGAGTMSVIAPITAVAATAVPVIFGLALGDRPGLLPTLGVALALVAIVLVSAVPGATGADGATTHPGKKGIGVALAAGTAFGCFYVLIHNAAPAAGVWPLAAARVASVSAYLLFAIATGRAVRAPTAAIPTIAVTGALDMAAISVPPRRPTRPTEHRRRRRLTVPSGDDHSRTRRAQRTTRHCTAHGARGGGRICRAHFRGMIPGR